MIKKMKFDIFYVDAFSKEVFSGNPAAVIFKHFEDEKMQSIASENNLSETAFIDLENNYIRWFSPKCEVDLCGHATLAAAHVFFEYIDNNSSLITFNSNSGELKAYKKDSVIYLDIRPVETYLGDINLFAVFSSENQISSIRPNFNLLEKLPGQGLIISSSGDKYDFVSRYFCPKFGINEDPVTGSAHTTLIPYWSYKLPSCKADI